MIKLRKKLIETGAFYCPECKQVQTYSLFGIVSQSFLSINSRKALSKYVKCNTCTESYGEAVLSDEFKNEPQKIEYLIALCLPLVLTQPADETIQTLHKKQNLSLLNANEVLECSHKRLKKIMMGTTLDDESPLEHFFI